MKVAILWSVRKFLFRDNSNRWDAVRSYSPFFGFYSKKLAFREVSRMGFGEVKRLGDAMIAVELQAEAK